MPGLRKAIQQQEQRQGAKSSILEPRSVGTMTKTGKQGRETPGFSEDETKPLETREDLEVVTLEVSAGSVADRKPNRVLVTKWADKIPENGKEICSQDFLTSYFQPHH